MLLALKAVTFNVKSFQHSSERQNLRPLQEGEEEHGEAKIDCKYRCDGWPNEKCHVRKNLIFLHSLLIDK